MSLDFDDSKWEVITPEALEERRATGKLSFVWYRIRVIIPEKVGSSSTTGSTAVFKVVVDDYAEVWVDGELPQVLGTRGGALAAGWNAPNRVVIARDARPGQTIQLAVFGANAPISDPPSNFVWVRSATLDFYRPECLETSETMALEVQRLDPALDAILGRDAKLARVAKGTTFTEGPVWVNDTKTGGYLLFSGPNENVIHCFAPGLVDGVLTVYRTKSGYKGTDIRNTANRAPTGLRSTRKDARRSASTATGASRAWRRTARSRSSPTVFRAGASTVQTTTSPVQTGWHSRPTRSSSTPRTGTRRRRS